MSQRSQKFLARNRIRLSLLIFAIFITKDIIDKVHPHDIFDFRDVWGPLGLLLVLAGVGLRSWAAGIIHKSESLAMIGPYSLTRHPLYIGSLLLALGFCTIIGDRKNFLVVFAIAIIFYVPKVQREETRLANSFGEQWREYVRRTSVFFPKSRPRLRTVWSLKQWLGNSEYYAFSTCMIALTLLKLYHDFTR
jgi:protein-S-isoprenylcysteine O-methyltransferase Ste14